MPPIGFSAELRTIGSSTILHLPKTASSKLPSRGMTMVQGTINGKPLLTWLEPDGKGSHWFSLSESMRNGMKGGAVELEIEPIKDWPEPEIPADIQKGLIDNPQIGKLWQQCTVAARWDWIRWIRSTKNSATRAKRIVVAASKLRAGERRPCCFNRSACTEPTVCPSGVLLGQSK